MTYTGTVKNGVIVLPPEVMLPEGSEVDVITRGRWIASGKSSAELNEEQAADEANELASMAAETSSLPADLSTNHDHYLHGLPKR